MVGSSLVKADGQQIAMLELGVNILYILNFFYTMGDDSRKCEKEDLGEKPFVLVGFFF